MKAITLWQPWASWVAWGWKTVETRIHNRFRSLAGERIAIHAGRHWDGNALKVAQLYMHAGQVARHFEIIESAERDYPCGAIVALATVTDADWNPATTSWASRHSFDVEALCPTYRMFCLHLDEVVALQQPISIRGHQGLWHWNPEGGVDRLLSEFADVKKGEKHVY